jgi:glycerol-3-phosphate cytidylyltransferase
MPRPVIVTGAFDDLRSRDIRFLEEAAKLGEVTALVWSDAAIARLAGKPPRFPEAERSYLLNSIRFIREARCVNEAHPDELPLSNELKPPVWAMPTGESTPAKRAWCAAHGVALKEIPDAELRGFPDPLAGTLRPATRKKVLVTGSYDWFHSGHVRFFEEVSAVGDLYVVVGHDANIRLLKGEGHPLLPETERRYVVSSIRFVHQALISTGHGWLDAEPEIARLKPDIYAVNEDGDKGGKREFCRKQGIEYLVLKRRPAPGLPHRSSTGLRGF